MDRVSLDDRHVPWRNVFPRGSHRILGNDPSVAPVHLATAADNPLCGNSGWKRTIKYNEPEVNFPIVSVGEAGQLIHLRTRLPYSAGADLKRFVQDPTCQDRDAPMCGSSAPLYPNPTTAVLVVEILDM